MSKKILIIDDDPDILQVIQIILEEAGFQVILDDGTGVYKKVLSHKPHLILLDARLAGKNGVNIAKRLKFHPKTRSIPLIFVSADLSIEEKTKEAGADGYIKKPFDIDELESTVKRFVKKDVRTKR